MRLLNVEPKYAPCKVRKDAAHDARADGEKMVAVLPAHFSAIHEAHVDFVNETVACRVWSGRCAI